MSKKKFDYLVFIGRMGPYHIGHDLVVQEALELADNVIICIGSSFRPRTIKNPWTYKERERMITGSLSKDQRYRLIIRPLNDIMYNDDAWITQVQNVVNDTIIQEQKEKFLPKDLKIGIIGHEKDESSFYLRLFPQWEQVNHTMNEVVHPTDIRALLFEQKNFLYLQGLLSPVVYEQVKQFTLTSHFKQLKTEYEFIQNYKAAWAAAPYEPTFMTADAVVVQSGHVLMVIRDAAPGEGLHAIPGGFVNPKEYIECAALRELKDETKIDVPAKVLRGSIKHSKIFDHPQRSLRGRTITQAFLIELPPGPLPKVKGGDDARHAKWVPFNEISSETCFEDHYDIIQYFIR